MRILRVVEDVNTYQSLSIEDDRLWQGDQLTFDCANKADIWTPPDVYILHPKLKRGHFSHLCPGALAVHSSAIEALHDLFEQSGELLPLSHKDDKFWVLNVTECVNALDEDMTRWILGSSTGVRIGIEKYSFHSSRLTETPLFKIPQTCRSEILICEGLRDPTDEFKGRIERLGLKGLNFEEIWRERT